MKLTLSPELRPRLALFLLGTASYFLLEFHAALLLAYFILRGSWPLAAAAGGLLLLLSWGLHACLRARRFLLAFGRWHEIEVAEEPSKEGALSERRDLLRGARQAFDEGALARAQALLERYLALRPADNGARLNLAWALASDGLFERARNELGIAGDPLKQDRLLDPERSGFSLWKRSFSPGDAEASRHGAGPLWAGALGLVLGLSLACADLFVLLKGYSRYLELGSRRMILELVKGDGNFALTDFKSLSTDSYQFYYHDEAAMQELLPMAEAALDYNLRFYVLPEGQFRANKIKVYLMDSQEEFLRRSPHHKSWEAGVTLDELQEIYLYRLPRHQRTSFEITFAHEVSHVCYRKVISGIDQESWLNEGLASYIGYHFGLERRRFAVPAWLREYVFKDVAKAPIPFGEFLSGNPQGYGDTAKISQFYDQGFSIAYVLINYYGKDSFIRFLHSYSRHKDLLKGLQETYPTIQSLDALHGVWLLFMK